MSCYVQFASAIDELAETRNVQHEKALNFNIDVQCRLSRLKHKWGRPEVVSDGVLRNVSSWIQEVLNIFLKTLLTISATSG